MKLQIEQAQKSKNFRLQNEITERGAVTKGKEQNSFTKRKTRECYQWKPNGSCSRGASCSFLHTLASGNREITREEVVNARRSGLKPAAERVRNGKEQTSSSVPKVKAHTDVKSSTSLEASPATKAEIFCMWGGNCKISSCDYRHPPVCRDCKSGNRCIHGNHCLFRHADGEEKPSKRSKRESTQGAVAILRQ